MNGICLAEETIKVRICPELRQKGTGCLEEEDIKVYKNEDSIILTWVLAVCWTDEYGNEHKKVIDEREIVRVHLDKICQKE